MKKVILFSIPVLFGFSAFSQNLDRISLSSGGSATDEVNYVLGETFNFTLADGANVIIETGTLGSSDDTGGDNNFTAVKQLAINSALECYPNPTTDFVNVNLTGFQNLSGLEEELILSVYDITGKVVKMQNCTADNLQTLNVSKFAAGTYFISVSDNFLKPINSVKFIKK